MHPFRVRGSFLVVLAVVAGLCLPTAAQAAIVINEIHYNPDVKIEQAEFIELFNSGTNAVNLGGWHFDAGIDYTFSNNVTIVAGGYVVVAQNPASLAAKFPATLALGPYAGGFSKYGEKVTLKNSAGDTVNEVEYQLGFPWPTVGDPPGYSIELIHPSLDNSLGGSWRASSAAGIGQTAQVVIPDHSTWNYVPGTNEASAPVTAWRQPGFNDSNWASGGAPIGFGEAFIVTALPNMRSNYVCVFFRKKFVVSDVIPITSLLLEGQFDDGAKVWINGTNVLNANMPAAEVPYTGVANSTVEAQGFSQYILNNPASYLVNGTNIIAVQCANVSLDGGGDFVMDLRLTARSGPLGNGPTPGRVNAVYATNAPPQIRQVEHSPGQPRSGQTVTITAKVTDPDGVTNVVLQYQLVDPGNYIQLTDPAYSNTWTSLTMTDNGSGGDAVAGDDVYTVQLPGSFQVHRRLIRYRIIANDSGGRSIRVPYADDPQPNFAYFCYNGVPAYSGAVQPGAAGTNGVVVTVSSNEMNRLPVYHLLARSNSFAVAIGWAPGQPNNMYGGDNYLWTGALVVDGKVYDHIGFRCRGGVWRYSMGKNAMKFALSRGHDLEVKDNWGRKFNAVWRRLSFRPNIQQGDFLHRGEQGLFESVGYRLFELAGGYGLKNVQIQFRVIDNALETVPGDQYGGDFYGLWLVVEEDDGRFLEERGLADGNIYDMEGGSGTLNHTGLLGPVDKSDLNSFINTYTTTTPTEAWWRTNLNLPAYYSYQAIVQGIHQYDIADGKNYFYYKNSATGLWTEMPWDLDLTWADNMYRSDSTRGDEPFRSRVLSNFASPGTNPNLSIEFRNRVREIRDLLYNNDQAFKLIDEYKSLTRGTNTYSMVEADRMQWDYNPVMVNTAIINPSKAGQGRFYQWSVEPTVSKNFDGCIQLMKNYINYRSTTANLSGTATGMDGIAADAARPNRPTLTYTGPTNYPVNRLTFHSSNFGSPSNNIFASMKWRIAEVQDPSAPAFDPSAPHPYEIEATWEGTNNTFVADVTLPPAGLKTGLRYRVRVQHKDNTGRTSNWSLPQEFVLGDSSSSGDLLNYLRLTEIMFNPPPGGYEFIELHNSSSTVTLDLAGVKFTQGVDFTFATGTTLLPGAYLLVVGTTNIAAVRAYYGLDGSVPIYGPYSGSLNNGGEQLTLRTAAGGTDIVSFDYRDGRGWPVAADGAGHSLVLLDTAEAAQGSTSGDSGSGEYGGSWRMSAYLRGSPGGSDTPPAATILLNEIVAHTDFTNEISSNDWIELYNATDAAITLGPGWYLSDDGATLTKWQIPSNTVIAAHGWVSFDEVTSFHNPTNIGFGLDKGGEQVFLSHLTGTAQDRVVDAVSFKAQENDWSLGRYPDGGPYWYALTPRTRDTANAAPQPGMVITEVMYHPPDIGGTNDNSLDEFVEIHNPTAAPIALFNSNGVWRLDGVAGDGNFLFPSNLTVAAGGYLLVVNFAPTNTAQSNLFITTYSITNAGLTLAGPYSGKLPNNSGRVALEKPQGSDPPGGAPDWVIVDEVIYADGTPWPCGSDATGNSLQRISATQHGSDPLNWSAQSPTPGEARVALPPGLPAITAQPASRNAATNSTVTFSVLLCGTPPFAYQWRFQGTDISGATNATLILLNVTFADAGPYDVLVSNAAGSLFSDPATLNVQTPPVITAPPSSQAVIAGTTAVFNVTAGGSGPLQYQWRFNSVDIPGATNTSYTVTNAQTAQAGPYTVLVFNGVGSALSANATLTVNNPPTITTPPANLTVTNGNNATFTVAATGTGALFYQWRFGGTNLAGGTSTNLTLTNVQAAAAGPYTIVVTNLYGSASASAVLTVLVKPVITAQPSPTNVFLLPGSNYTMSISASGTLPLSFRWRKVPGGINLTNFILNDTTSTLTITNAQPSTNGVYTVVITNLAGATTPQLSVAVFITVQFPPVITNSPVSQTVMAGASASFSVGASGSALGYQWRHNGDPIANATNATLTLTNVQPASEGSYTVAVTNQVAAALSAPATLAVVVAPVVAISQSGGAVTMHWNATYGVRYRIQYQTNLSQLGWLDLAPDVTAEAATAEKIDAIGGGQLFYRVLVLSLP